MLGGRPICTVCKSNIIDGKGMKKRGKGVITSNIDNFFHHGMGIGLGGTHESVVNSISQSNALKMAHARSFRNVKQGGSFAPL